MAELRKMHLTISKGMKLYCTVEQASEDVIVVSLKHKSKEYRGVLLDSSERHLPAGLCFNSETGAAKPEGENAGNTGADGADPAQGKEARGVTLDCRYSYNNDPAKYNEQPLPTTSAISIRPARGKQVRNIRLRPRQTLCSKCKAAIHDSKSKSPNKVSKSDSLDQDAHPHNTRYRAALTNKPNDSPNTPPGPTLRSGSRNKRSESTPKVLLENIRPRREVKPTAKKREADAAQRSRLGEAASKKNNVYEDRSSDSSGIAASKQDVNKPTEASPYGKKLEDNYRVILERSVSLDNPNALGQYNKQPVVRLDKSAVNNMNIRTEVKEDKQEKAPTISIVNIRSTPAIKISYGAGDRDVLKIPPRLPGTELKSPDDHSTADESPAPVTPPRPSSPPQKKTKKASKRTRDKQKQRYRIISDGDAASEVHAPGIKIAGYHRKHKRKHKHRHASSEDENFNSEVDIPPPPAKLPAIITKFSVVPSVNDLNGNEKKGDTEVLKDSSNETPTRQEETEAAAAKSPFDLEPVGQIKRNESTMEFAFDDDPLKLKTDVTDSVASLDGQSPRGQVAQKEDSQDQSETGTSESLPAKSDIKPFEMWGSPVHSPAFENEGSPTHIEAPPFQSDDSQDGLIVGPLRMGSSPTASKDENMSSFDSLPTTPQATEENQEFEPAQEEEEKKESVPYGVGMFEDLTPDEDEDDHDDSNVSQPMYQLPKKRLPLYTNWSSDGLGYLSKKSDDPYNQTSVYQNGPNSFYNPGPSSLYSANSNFPNSPAPRIQNSPTPIIQRSPMPIFNYSASRYQSSPNRRFGSSPSRRYQSLGDSGSRQQSVISGSLSHSRYQAHEVDRFQTARDSMSSSSGGYRSQSQSHMGDRHVSHPDSSSRYSSKFHSQTGYRYQSSSEKSGTSRYPSQSQSGGMTMSRLSSSDDTGLSIPKSQGSAENSSSLRYVWSSGDSGSLPRFAIPSNGNSTVPQYSSQGGSSSSLPHYSTHPVDGNLSQYSSLGSTEARFQPHSESHYKAHSSADMPAPLPLQKNSKGVSNFGASSVYATDKKDRVAVSNTPQYETVDTSALFMTHSHIQNPASSSENVPRFLNKPLSSVTSQNRLPSTDSAKSRDVFGDSVDSMYAQNAKVLSGSGAQGLGILGGEQGGGGGGSSMSRRPSSASISQSNLSVNISDSEDDADNAVPGCVSLAMLSSSRELSHMMTALDRCVEGGREIRVGCVYWGKDQGCPWWPCRVVLIKPTHRDLHVCQVEWFGTRTYSELHPYELRPFREEFSIRHATKNKRGPYHQAIQDALMVSDSLSPSLPSMDLSPVPPPPPTAPQQHLKLLQ